MSQHDRGAIVSDARRSLACSELPGGAWEREEVRRRLQQIVDTLENKPESLRAVRAVEVLEWIGTPDAVGLIRELADGAAEARLTREAVAARGRLRR